MKSLSLSTIATLLFTTSTAAALAAAYPGSVYERPVAVPVDQNDSHPAFQQEQQLPIEFPPATIQTLTQRPCSSFGPTTTAVAVDESQYYNPIQQLPIVTTTTTTTVSVTVTKTAAVSSTATAAVTSSALRTVVTPTTSPVLTNVPKKRKCIRKRVKTAIPTATAVVDDFGYGAKPGKTDMFTATASAATAAPTNVYEQPAGDEPAVAKSELSETSAGFKSTVSGAAAVMMVLGAGLVL